MSMMEMMFMIIQTVKRTKRMVVAEETQQTKNHFLFISNIQQIHPLIVPIAGEGDRILPQIVYHDVMSGKTPLPFFSAKPEAHF